MNHFNPGDDRLKQLRQAETLAGLREAAADPSGAKKLAAAVQEPDPTEIHRGILRRRFPNLPNIAKGWPRGLPDLRALAGLAQLAAYFSPAAILRRRQVAQHFRSYFRSSPEQQRRMEIATLGHPLRFARRSIWRQLAFWRRR